MGMIRLGKTGKLACVALALTLGQVAWLLALAPAGDSASRYDRLCCWDSGWYKSILEDGYHTTIPPVPQDGARANVGFFPGFPLAARAVKKMTGLSNCHSMLVTAQVSCWAFWLYALLILAAWQVPAGLSAAACALIALHPAAFFLVTGYSESLFMAALAGFLYWLLFRPPGRTDTAVAGLHGFVMTATRIVGVPLAFVPLGLPLLTRAEQSLAASGKGGPPLPVWRGLGRLATIGALSGAGAFSFLAFCRVAFGHWDVYMQTLAIGWSVKSDYLAFFHPSLYLIPRWLINALAVRKDTHVVSQLSVPLTMYQLLLMLGLEAWAAFRGRSRGLAARAVLYVCAWLLFYASISGRVSLLMMGMVRYSFCTYALLILAAADLAGKSGWVRPRGAAGWAACAALAVLAIAMICGQYWLGWNFVHGQWAA